MTDIDLFDDVPDEPAWGQQDPLADGTPATPTPFTSAPAFGLSGPSTTDTATHHASPFSVAATTAVGMTAVRALRDAWRRRAGMVDAPDAETAPSDHAADGTGEPAPQDPTGRSDQLDADRTVLVSLCVELDDLIANPALQERLRRGLRRVGVEAFEPHGARFDPEIHRAVGTAQAPDREHDLLIQGVERAGFRDRGVEIRPAEVIVYRFEAEQPSV